MDASTDMSARAAAETSVYGAFRTVVAFAILLLGLAAAIAAVPAVLLMLASRGFV